MAVTKKTLDDIRKELKRSGTEDRVLTSKEIVFELAPTIHEQMCAGARLMTLYAIVKAKLPAEARLSEATFRKYWRDARDELGLAPIKASAGCFDQCPDRADRTPTRASTSSPRVVITNGK